jgi:3-oxo-5alpha-steroid 4-dehydrogenase
VVDKFKPLSKNEVCAWDAEVDVLVVGFGAAGACAAIAAHDNGAKVMLIEAASDAGGSTALSSAELYLGGGTRVQKAVGYEDTAEAMYQYLMMANGPQASAEKTRRYCEESVEHFDWLVEQDIPFKDSEYPHRAMMALTDDCLLFTGSEKAWPFRDQIPPAPRGHNLYVEGDNGGPLFMKIMAEGVAKRAIETRFETRVLKLIIERVGEQVRVCGAVIRQDMQERTIAARKGVVLCCGGFVMNEEMIAQYAPELKKASMPIGNPNDTGSGIKMGMSVGGAVINMHEGFVSLPYYPPATLTYGILVNAQGQRFINEDAYHGRVGAACLRQVGGPVYFIMSIDDYEGYETQSYLGSPIGGTGETLDELAAELNLPEGQLQHCVETYNRFASEGKDPLFHKDAAWLKPITPPLVALDCTPGNGTFYPYFTLGGLDTTVDGEVKTAGGEVIPGLYAAGRTACGVPRRGDGYASGTSVGDASFSGRVAGLHIARS